MLLLHPGAGRGQMNAFVASRSRPGSDECFCCIQEQAGVRWGLAAVRKGRVTGPGHRTGEEPALIEGEVGAEVRWPAIHWLNFKGRGLLFSIGLDNRIFESDSLEMFFL